MQNGWNISHCLLRMKNFQNDPRLQVHTHRAAQKRLKRQTLCKKRAKSKVRWVAMPFGGKVKQIILSLALRLLRSADCTQNSYYWHTFQTFRLKLFNSKKTFNPTFCRWCYHIVSFLYSRRLFRYKTGSKKHDSVFVQIKCCIKQRLTLLCTPLIHLGKELCPICPLSANKMLSWKKTSYFLGQFLCFMVMFWRQLFFLKLFKNWLL